MMSAQRTETITRRTFVVLGCPRGGTSLIAGALRIAGVYMGECETRQHEDPEFKIPVEEAGQAALRLAPVIEKRNREHAYWGWKVPNCIHYIRSVRRLLVNPRFLFVYRDPKSIARSSAYHDGRDWEQEKWHLLRVAAMHTLRVRAFQWSTLSFDSAFRVESIHASPNEFVEKFRRIVSPLPLDRDRLLAFIDSKGGYRRLP